MEGFKRPLVRSIAVEVSSARGHFWCADPHFPVRGIASWVVDSLGGGRQGDEGSGGLERAASPRTAAGEPGPIAASEAEEGPRHRPGRAGGDPGSAARMCENGEGGGPATGAAEDRVGQGRPDPCPLPHLRLQDRCRSNRSPTHRTDRPLPALGRVSKRSAGSDRTDHHLIEYAPCGKPVENTRHRDDNTGPGSSPALPGRVALSASGLHTRRSPAVAPNLGTQ